MSDTIQKQALIADILILNQILRDEVEASIPISDPADLQDLQVDELAALEGALRDMCDDL